MPKEKKIRGWKKCKKIIQDWRLNYVPNMKIDVTDPLPEWERVLCPFKASPYPFFTFVEPPKGYRNELFAGLLDIYDVIEKQFREASQPCFVEILLYENMFFQSRVHWCLGEKSWYDATKIPGRTEKPFPVDKFQLSAERLREFHWTRYLEQPSWSVVECSKKRKSQNLNPNRPVHCWTGTKMIF